VSSPEILAIVPAYNEAPRIAAVVAGLVGQGLPVLVVDDGSTDGTGEVARGACAEVLRLEPQNTRARSLLESALARQNAGGRP